MAPPSPQARPEQNLGVAAPSANQSNDALRSCYSDNLGGPYQFPQAFLNFSVDPKLKLPSLEISTDCKYQNLKNQASPPSKPEEKHPGDQGHAPGKSAEKKDSANKPAAHVESKDERLKTTARKNGLTIKIVNGKYEYHEIVNGKDQIVFTTDGTEDDANLKIQELVQKKEAALTAKYGVQFAKAGDQAKFKDIANEPKSGECREPTLKELEGLDAALSKNRYTPDGKAGPPPPKIFFLKDNVCPGFAAIYDQSQSGMFVMPGWADGLKATNKGASPDEYTVEGNLSHELNHWAHDWEDRQKAKGATANGVNTGADKQTGEDPAATPPIAGSDPSRSLTGQDKPTPAPNSDSPTDKTDSPPQPNDNAPEPTDTEKARYERLGWKELTTAGGKVWVVEDKNHHYWLCAEDSKGERNWVRVNEQGLPVNAEGAPVITEADKNLTEEQLDDKVRKSGVVISDGVLKTLMKPQPATIYFPTPEEELSEAESLYHDKTGRHYLAATNWQLYQEAKQLDQERINEASGTGANGEPLYIRSPDGSIVPNDAQHRAEVQKFEDAARHRAVAQQPR